MRHAQIKWWLGRYEPRKIRQSSQDAVAMARMGVAWKSLGRNKNPVRRHRQPSLRCLYDNHFGRWQEDELLALKVATRLQAQRHSAKSLQNQLAQESNCRGSAGTEHLDT